MRLSHVSWNLAGLSLPLLVAAITVPHLISMLGHERFGLLALAWGLIGYAGALDLGIGRATTQYIARLKAGGGSNQAQIPIVLVTAVRLTLIAGGIGALIIVTAALLNIGKFVRVDQVDSIEIKISIFLLALALPMQAVSATYRGVNEAYLNFKGVSYLRICLGMANFGVPFLVALYSIKMYYLIGSLVFSRGVSLIAYKFLADSCIMVCKNNNKIDYSPAISKELFNFGGWFTLSGIVNPLVATADRFFISSVVSAAAVSFYVVPYEMVAQSLILVGAVTTVTFPYFSQLRISDPNTVKAKFFNILGIVLLGMILVATGLGLFGKYILEVWMGVDLAGGYYPVMKVLIFGLVPYTLGTMCVSILHAYGRTDLTGKLNLIEFPIFIYLIFELIGRYGISGAAYAWVTRVVIDSFILLALVLRLK